MALGGQGAPLVPAFHQTIFSESFAPDNLITENALTKKTIKKGNDVFIVNIGGIANITFLPASTQSNVIGYDTGTGNALMDDWYRLHNPNSNTHYDKNGDWAATGKINHKLLKKLLSDDYFFCF